MKQSSKYVAIAIAVAAGFAINPQAFAQADDGKEYPFGQRSIFSDRATEERIKPSGDLCMQGENCAGVAMADAGAADQALTPEQTYNNKCMSCHATGAAGAPKVGDAAAWASRLEKGFEKVVQNAINGVNAMPPKGLCMDCSDEDIHNIVQYMVDNSQ